MKKSELVEGSGGQHEAGTLSCALKLRILKDGNLRLEQHLAAVVVGSRALQAMRSGKFSFKS